MARAKKAKISSKTPSPAFDAHVTAYWTNAAREAARIRRLVHCSPDPDAHIRAWRRSLHDAHVGAWLGTPEALRATVERLEREDADALADDLAAALDANPDVIRAKLRTLRNDLYQLNDESNDWWDETQRAEAEAKTMAAFAEKLEDLSLDVRRSQQNRKRQDEIEARRVQLNALILAEVDAATATVKGKWPDTPPLRGAVNHEIAAALKRKGVNGGRPVGLRRIEQARKGH